MLGKRKQTLAFVNARRIALAAMLTITSAIVAEPLPTEVINQGRTLVATGQAIKAYQYLLQFESSYAGIPEYDYLLGVAAADSGNANYAVLALQRSVAVNPRFVGARLDLGRSYFLLKQYDDARNEFTSTLSYNPPDTTRKLIDRYLDLIDKQQDSGGEFDLSFRAGGAAGSDNNANSATSATFANFTITPQTPSLFYSATSGGSLRYIANPQWIVSGDAQYTQRNNLSASFVNYKQLETGLNVQHFTEKDYVKMDATVARVDIGGALVSYNGFVSYFSRHKHIYNNSFNYMARGGTVRYAGEDKSRDIYQFMLGGGYATELPSSMPLTTTTTFILGRISPIVSTSPVGNFLTGVRVHSDWAIFQRFHAFIGGGTMLTQYDKKFFGESRYDGKVDAMAGLLLLPFKGWSLQPQATYAFNKSTVSSPIFDFSRLEYSMSLNATIF